MSSRRFVQAICLLMFVAGVTSVAVATQGAILKDAELRKIGASATTAAEHNRLVAHYRAHAAEHEADAATHEAIVKAARERAADDDAWDLARDAAHYAEHSREAAEALKELATLHEEMAKRAKPGR